MDLIMNDKLKYIVVAVSIVFSNANAETTKLSTDAGPNVKIVDSVSPSIPANASMPFPESTPKVSETTDTSNMREKLVADAIGKTQGARFPDQTSYGQTQRGTTARASGTQQEMMTTKQALMEKLSPIAPEDMKEALANRDRFSASLNQPIINSVPRTSSQTISLAAGSAYPVVRVAPGRPTYIVFEDITGAPWPLSEQVMNSGGSDRFFVRSYTNTPIVLVQPLVSYGNGDIGVLLKDLPVPISIVLANVEPDAVDKTYKYDSRINIRIPRRGPLAPKYSITSIAKIGLSSPELQSLLDGIPPSDAIRLKTDNSLVSAWRRADKMYLRTSMESKTQFSKTLSSADGTHVYEMELSPFVAMMQSGSTVTIKVEL